MVSICEWHGKQYDSQRNLTAETSFKHCVFESFWMMHNPKFCTHCTSAQDDPVLSAHGSWSPYTDFTKQGAKQGMKQIPSSLPKEEFMISGPQIRIKH